MSGWIKLEKATCESLRFKRFAKELSRSVTRDVTESSIVRNETVALGCLTRLWLYADSHIADDNILEATLDEIDEIVGIEGFAKLLPADWLKVIDANHVELPDFLQHNGTSAKVRKQGAQRQARYRHRKQSASPSRDVTPSNALRDDARPEETRPDKTREDQDIRKNTRVVPRGTAADIFDGVKFFREKLKHLYPTTSYTDADEIATGRALEVIVSEGLGTCDELVANTIAFQLQQRAKGSEGTQFVKNPRGFYSSAGHWRGPFPLPASKAQVQQDQNIEVSQKWLQQGRA